MVTRVERTSKYRHEVVKAWYDKHWSFIMENLDKPWNWYWISYNPNLTMDIIKEYHDRPWDWYAISYNKFARSKQEFISKRYREYLAAYRIQQWWHRLRLDPRHPVGMRMLEREYTELFKEIPSSTYLRQGGEATDHNHPIRVVNRYLTSSV